MSEQKVGIEEKVMEKIHTEKIKMRPRIYFIFGSLAFFVATVSAMVISAFFINLTMFAWRVNCPMKFQRLEMLWSNFPWWAPLLGVLGFGIGFWLLKKSNFSYKKNFWVIVFGLLVAIFVASWLIDYLNFNQLWLRHKSMRGLWQQQVEQVNNGINRVGGCGRHLR